jgi:ribosomal protein S18 acetylase RimI-like enzyme
VDVRLGELRLHDRARVAELLVSTRAFSREEVAVALELFDESFADRESAGADDAHVGDADYEFIGAYDGDRLLGYACVGPTPATDGTFDLYWLAVDAAAQGNGIGRTLVREVERDLAERGGRLLLVETSSRPDYEKTRAFYARCGYTESARIKDFYAPADDRILLTTRLTSTSGFTTRERGATTR